MTQQKINDLLTAQEASERIRTSPNTMAYWRMQGTGPAWAKIGRRIFYSAAGLDRFVADQFEKNGGVA